MRMRSGARYRNMMVPAPRNPIPNIMREAWLKMRHLPWYGISLAPAISHRTEVPEPL
jgi:hypothetical protein